MSVTSLNFLYVGVRKAKAEFYLTTASGLLLNGPRDEVLIAAAA